MLFSIVLCSLVAPRSYAGDNLRFAVADDTQLQKKLRISHELQIEHMGESHDDGPSVSQGTGGWLSSSERLEFIDHYLKHDDRRPLQFVRAFRGIDLEAKATISRGGSQLLPEKSKSTSQLSGKSVEFTWVEAEKDWARCFARVEAEEEVLAPLHGEYDLLVLLPGREVAVGDQWDIDIRRVREFLAPCGDVSMLPATGSLFGRLTELGVGGDFADFLAPECAGVVTATYRGVRELAPDPSDDEDADEDTDEDASKPVRVGVVELSVQLASELDRGPLYRTVMPDGERREPSRVESVPLQWTFQGKGELLWDLEAGHFHSFSLAGDEAFDISVNKTFFVAGRDPTTYAQQARYSGKLSFEVSAGPVTAEIKPQKPEGAKKGGGKKKHKK